MNDGKLVEVVEHTQLQRDGGLIRSEQGGVEFDPGTPVSMNIWGFTPAFFKLARPVLLRHFDRAAESEITELQLPTVINTMLDAGAIEVLPVTGGTEWFGMTYRTDLDAVQAAIRDLTDAGVYPDPLWSRADA